MLIGPSIISAKTSIFLLFVEYLQGLDALQLGMEKQKSWAHFPHKRAANPNWSSIDTLGIEVKKMENLNQMSISSKNISN